jgi:hypothetical protein
LDHHCHHIFQTSCIKLSVNNSSDENAPSNNDIAYDDNGYDYVNSGMDVRNTLKARTKLKVTNKSKSKAPSKLRL